MRGSVNSILIDDGTGKIVLRIFEENKAAFELEIGDVVQVIGKVRIFNQEKYIFPEVIKKTNSLWLKVRFSELQKNKQISSDALEGKNKEKKKIEAETVEKVKKEESAKPLIKEEKSKEKELKILNIQQKQPEQNTNSEILEVISEEIEENDPLLPYEIISKLISQLDKGEGVMIEEILEKSPLDKTEELIEKMLENGDIFQNMPGKVKLL